MKGKLKDLTFDRDGKQNLTVTLDDDFRETWDELNGSDVEISVKKYRKKRSLDANSFCWLLCSQLAEAMSNDKAKYTKEDIYRETIRQVGIFKDFTEIDPSQAETLKTAWGMLGTGWVSEQVDYSHDGDHVTIRCYYGSSQYNTKQMSRLIDSLVQDCKAIGIPTETPNTTVEQLEKAVYDRK